MQNKTECNCKSSSVNEFDFTALDEIIDVYQGIEGSLISILQKAQTKYGYLSPETLNRVSEKTGIPLSRIIGVATFYTQFRFEPAGKYVIMLCQGTACHVNGSEKIEQAIMDELHIKDGQTTGDGLFTLKNVACLGCCSLSPVMMINNETYGSLTAEKTRKILREIKAND